MSEVIGGKTVHALASIFPMVETDFAELKADIAANGLHNAIVLWDDCIIDGRHRARACDELGIAPVYTTFDGDDDAALRYVISANVKRRHLNESQRADIASDMATIPLGGNQHTIGGSAILPTLTQAEAAAALKVSPRLVRTAAKVKREAEPEVVAAVKSGTLHVSAAAQIVNAPPERQRAIAAKAATRKVTSDIHAVKRDVQRQGISTEAAKSVNGKKRYSVIYADPPWRFEDRYNSGGMDGKSPENHYRSMPLGDILELNVGSADNVITVDDIATDDAVLFLWIVDRYAREAFGIIDNWGFTYRAQMVWVKDGIGLGQLVRYKHEVLYIATRGKIPLPDESVRPASVIEAAKREHSRKPDEVYSIIEAMYPNMPRIELFSRNKRDGWDAWGNQATS